MNTSFIGLYIVKQVNTIFIELFTAVDSGIYTKEVMKKLKNSVPHHTVVLSRESPGTTNTESSVRKFYFILAWIFF